jgi:SpoIID/LytB domain protein
VLDGRAYRGRLEVTAQATLLRVVDHVGLDLYVQGVVAGEMPYQWPMEALKAQAVAARSYALANLVKGKPFDLYADQRSQVYLGVAGEQARTSDAVRATAGEVVTYGGKVASTLYFSSSGGRTASAADVFGIPAPYLVSRPDPWDKASPYHRWGPVLLGARTIQAKLGIGARVLDATGVPTPSGRLRALVVQTTDGPETVPASLLRTVLALRSTWITVGVLRLDRPRETVVFGSSLQMSGLARRVSSPLLSASIDGTAWATVAELDPQNGGAVSLQVKPGRTTRYRIEADEAISSALLIRVAPRVRLTLGAEPRVLVGTVRPRLAGALVTIERRQPDGWASVGDAVVDASGAFRVELTLAPGSYRARVAPTDGYAEGLAPVLTVAG